MIDSGTVLNICSGFALQMNNTYSSWEDIPQGSILGPYLLSKSNTTVSMKINGVEFENLLGIKIDHKLNFEHHLNTLAVLILANYFSFKCLKCNSLFLAY